MKSFCYCTFFAFICSCIISVIEKYQIWREIDKLFTFIARFSAGQNPAKWKRNRYFHVNKNHSTNGFKWFFLKDIAISTVVVNIDIVDLFDYAQESRRTWIEGNQVYQSNHVLIVGCTGRDGNKLQLFGSCLRASNPKEHPREVNITTATLFRNWEISCTCPAGRFKCKHQCACLVYIHK